MPKEITYLQKMKCAFLYWNTKMSLNRVGKVSGVSAPTVRKWVFKEPYMTIASKNSRLYKGFIGSDQKEGKAVK